MAKLGIRSLVPLYLILTIFGIMMLFPFYWMVLGSVSKATEMLVIPPKFWPTHFSLDSYVEIFVERHFARITWNSAYVTFFDVLGTILSCSIVAYGFSMFEFKGRKFLFAAMISTLLLPGQVTLIPHFWIWKELGTINTYVPLIAPSFLAKTFGVLLLHQHFKSLPRELYDSAYCDGANPLRILFSIYMQLSKPVLATLAIFTFLGSWNDTLHPLIYLNDAMKYTLPLALLILKGQYDTDITQNLAGSVITILPVAIIFLCGQRYFVEGVARAGLKG